MQIDIELSGCLNQMNERSPQTPVTRRRKSQINCSTSLGSLKRSSESTFLSRYRLAPKNSLSKRVIVSNSQQYFPHMPLLTNDETLKVDVHIRSTWGKDGYVSCSEIDFLDENRRPINVIKISPGHTFDKSINLDKLSDKSLIKGCRANSWHHPWPYARSHLIYTFTLGTTISPSSLRIWNLQSNEESNIKDIEITYNGKYLYKGVVPLKYGAILPLGFIDSMYSICTAPTSSLPIFRTDHVNLYFLESEDPESSVFAVHYIELFDEENRLLTVHDIAELKLNNFGPITKRASQIMFKDGIIPSSESEEPLFGDDRMFLMRKWGDNPYITFNLSHLMSVAYIRVWNYVGKSKLAVTRFRGTNGYGLSSVSLGISMTDLFFVEPKFIKNYIVKDPFKEEISPSYLDEIDDSPLCGFQKL